MVKFQNVEPEIIFQDKSVLVLNKPSGWVVNKAKTTKNMSVVQNWVERNLDFPISSSTELRSGIVHRLDKETSGVLLVAKNEKAFSCLQSQFKQRKVRKIYKALVHGELEISKDTIEAPVGRLPWNRKRFGVLVGGKKAATYYEVKECFLWDKKKYSLLDVFPKTGRTHQIRTHLKYIGHPVVSDDKYAGRKTARDDRKWCPRLFLHAYVISFNHPVTGKTVSYESKLPNDLETALKYLRRE